MSGPQPRLSQIPLWERHVDLVLSVMRDALLLLAARNPTGGEPAINRVLYECILQANRTRYDNGRPFLDLQVMWESRNQPSPTTHGGTAEDKIPDFQCGYVDHLCPDPLLSARNFVIECKRLGVRSRAGWDFNSRYVSDGIVRFIADAWQYGKHVGAGAMVGYINGLPLVTVIAEVNAAAKLHGIPSLTMPSGHTAPLHELEHVLTRSFAESPFQLAHLWIENSSPPSASTVQTAAPGTKIAPRVTKRTPARGAIRNGL